MRGGFSLSVAFPRRRLDAEAREAALESLGGDVVPSATVLVLPSSAGGSAASSASG